MSRVVTDNQGFIVATVTVERGDEIEEYELNKVVNAEGLDIPGVDRSVDFLDLAYDALTHVSQENGVIRRSFWDGVTKFSVEIEREE